MKTDTLEGHVEQERSNGQKIDSLEKILASLVGHMITVIDPETYTPTLTGYEIDSTAYKAKVVSCENGLLRLLTECLCDPHQKIREKAQLFVEVDRIKRVMISKSQKLLTL